jgi:pimeloyl-ACP methyl ester carboxylesterase
VTISPVWGKWPGPVGALAVNEPATSAPQGPNSGIVVISHGFPEDKGPRGFVPANLLALSERLASQSGWRVVACCLRGVGQSDGDFSVGGWFEDLRAVVDRASESASNGSAWVVGLGLTGSLAICLAASDSKVKGVASLASPATFSDWFANPSAALAYAREMDVVSTPVAAIDVAAWARPIAGLDPLLAARQLSGRPVLVLHGSDDDTVPTTDARLIAEAVGSSAELRILAGAGHRLNSDPRVMALLLGWLERQKT